MRKFRILHSAFLRLIYLFVFKKPQVLTLEYVDLVFQEKPLFLITWEFKKAFLIAIPEIDFKSYSQKSSFILNLPPQIDQLTIFIKSNWHSKKEVVKLHKLKFDQQIDFHINAKLDSVNSVSFSLPEIRLKLKGVAPSKSQPILKVPEVKVSKFIYPNS